MGTRYRMTLWVKTATIMLAFAVIPLFALGITIYYYMDAAYQTIITDTLQASALDTRNAVQSFLNERISQLVTIAETHSLDQLKNQANLDNVLSGLKKTSRFFSAIEILDNLGNRIDYAGPRDDTLEAFNNANGDWYRTVLSSGVYISDVFTDGRNTPHFFVAVALPDSSRWILKATVEAEAIDRIVRSAQAGKKGYAFIINKSNLLQTSPQLGGRRLTHPDGPDFSLITRTQVMKINYGAEESFVAVTHLQNLDWVLVMKEDYREQMAPLLKARYTQGLIVAGGVLLILGGAILIVRSVIRESARLTRRKIIHSESVAQSGKMIALGRMAAGIAHEINNPLAIVGGMAGWMKDLLDEPDIRASKFFETYRDCIAKIEREVRRCKTVTHRLLNFGRGIAPAGTTVDANRLLAEVVSLLESEAYFRDISIHVNHEEGLPPITTDPTKLQQVFFDILDESIDMLGKAGLIDVDTSYAVDSNELLITISRTSSPSSPTKPEESIDEQNAIAALHTKSTKMISASYSSVRKLGGRITVTESAEGRTTFTISLPGSTPSQSALE